MPAERVAMRQVREIIRLKFSAGVPTREIARRLDRRTAPRKAAPAFSIRCQRSATWMASGSALDAASPYSSQTITRVTCLRLTRDLLSHGNGSGLTHDGQP